MKKRIIISTFIILIACAINTQAAPKIFRAGAYAVDITPTNLPVIVNGGFLSATANKVNDKLHARCLVMDDGKTRIGICVIDSCLIPRELTDEAKRLINQATGLLPECISISAVHTHSAPSLMRCLGTDADLHYPAFLVPRIVEGFKRAIENLTPARVGWTVVPAPEYTHCRVWIRRPDKIDMDPFGLQTVRANMHPGYQNPDCIGPEGPSDPALTLLSVQGLNKQPIALLANYSMHYYGAAAVSADYYGRFAEKIQQLMSTTNQKPAFVGIMSQGTSGDQHWMDYGQPKNPPGIDAYAASLANIAFEACKKIRYNKWVPLAMRDRDLSLAVRLPDEQRLAWARELMEKMNGAAPKNRSEVYAREQLWLKDNPVRKVKLQALRIGGFGITTMATETFAIIGLKIKAQSPLQPTMNIELANGEEGYIMPPELFPLGGYNTWACRSAGLETNAEPKIVEALLGMLEEVSGKSRRKIVDTHGPYAKTLLRSKPFAYWRMNEFNGQALDATKNKRPAVYDAGVVFYLDGPVSPAFSGEGTVNRAAHFAGGRMTAPFDHSPKKYSMEFWFWNGLPSNIRDITGNLFACGDRLGIGGKGGATGRLVFSAGGSGETLTGSTEIPLKKWHQLVLTRDDRKVTVYLNGAVDITGEVAPPDPAACRTLFVGGGDDNSANFEGKIDEVAVYDRVLSSKEVTAHFKKSGF
ncbi:MAG: LamG domain-containing protein [Kiritimatiellae bacterium]|nr:LamG domain-containing protein [Kiritimatiellia bacterium]MDD5519708.1 LamG domain-containing protein [Kiritimatiellia bacterium]